MSRAETARKQCPCSSEQDDISEKVLKALAFSGLPVAGLLAPALTSMVTGVVESIKSSSKTTGFSSCLDDLMHNMDSVRKTKEEIGKHIHYGQYNLTVLIPWFTGSYMKSGYKIKLDIRYRCAKCDHAYSVKQPLLPGERWSDTRLHDNEYLQKFHQITCTNCNNASDIVSSALVYESEKKSTPISRIYVRVKSSGRLRDKVERRLLNIIIENVPDEHVLKYISKHELGQLRYEIKKEKDLVGDVNGIRIIAKNADTCNKIAKNIKREQNLWSIIQVENYFASPKSLDIRVKKGKSKTNVKTKDAYEANSIYIENSSYLCHIQIWTPEMEQKDAKSKKINHASFSELQKEKLDYRRDLVKKVCGADSVSAIQSAADLVCLPTR